MQRIDSPATPYQFDPRAVAITGPFRADGHLVYRAETNAPGIYAFLRIATDGVWWLCLRRDGWAGEPAIAAAFAPDSSRDWLPPRAMAWALDRLM
jgi:hypothetical protein